MVPLLVGDFGFFLFLLFLHTIVLKRQDFHYFVPPIDPKNGPCSPQIGAICLYCV